VAISQVQKVSSGYTGGGPTSTLSYTPVSAGNLVEVYAVNGGIGGTFTGSASGWTFQSPTLLVNGNGNPTALFAVYDVPAGAVTISIAATSATGGTYFTVVEWSGIATTSATVQSPAGVDSNNSSATETLTGTASGNLITMATGCIFNPPTQATCSPGSTSAGITQTTSGVGGGNITRSGDWLVSTGGSVTGTEQDGGGGAGETWIIMREYLAASGGGSFVAEDSGQTIAYSFASDLGLYVPRGSVDELPIAGTTLAAEEVSGPLIWMPVDYGSVPEPATDELPSHPFEESSLTIRPSDDVSAPARQVNSDDVAGTLFAALEGEGSTFLPPQTIDAIALPEPCEDHFSGVRGLEESSLSALPSVVDPPPLEPSPEDQLAFVSALEEGSPSPAFPASPDLPLLPGPSDDFPPPAASTLAVEEWSPPVPAQPVVEIQPVRAQEDTVHTSVASIAAEEQGAVLTLADAWQGAPYASQEELPAQATLDDASRPYSFAQDPQPASMSSPGEDVLGQIALEEASATALPFESAPPSYFSSGDDDLHLVTIVDDEPGRWPWQPPLDRLAALLGISSEDWVPSPLRPWIQVHCVTAELPQPHCTTAELPQPICITAALG
jgi:hypothetical protein